MDITPHMPIVYAIAERIGATLPRTVDLDDLIQDGAIGLMDAARKFDPNRGIKFATYASFRVHGAIMDGLRRMDWVRRTRPGQAIGEDTAKKQKARQVHSEDGLVFAIRAAPEQHDEAESRDEVRALLKGLNRQQRAICTLSGIQGMTLEEAGKAIGVHETRACQLRQQAYAVVRGRLSRARMAS